MAGDVYKTDSNCHSWSKNRSKLKYKLHLQLLFETGPLEFVSIEILGPLPKKKKGNELVLTTMTNTRNRH